VVGSAPALGRRALSPDVQGAPANTIAEGVGVAVA